MNLTIKNARVVEILDIRKKKSADLDEQFRGMGLEPGTEISKDLYQKTVSKYYEELGDKDRAANVLTGYVEPLFQAAEAAGIQLDLTYGTAGNLAAALTALYEEGEKENFRPEGNRYIMGRTLATYLTLLALNENNFKLFVEKTNKRPPKDVVWSEGFLISVGKDKRHTDFLPFCAAAVKAPEEPKEKGEAAEGEPESRGAAGVIIDTGIVARKFKTLTGTDLGEVGFNGLALL